MKRLIMLLLFITFLSACDFIASADQALDVHEAITKANRAIDSGLARTNAELNKPSVLDTFRFDTTDFKMEKLPPGGVAVDSSAYTKDVFYPAQK